ncbi:unnamed protein product [Ectocarpus sp. 12 AP-2014]
MGQGAGRCWCDGGERGISVAGCANVWGASVIPDSPQLSALVADHAPADQTGSLLTFQTALGFALTMITVQATPVLAGFWGWQPVLVVMALGPVIGVWAMRALMRAR